MDSQVEDVKSRLNIVDVVGGYLRLAKSGSHWKTNCPFHNEKTPSFMVNEERQIWHCFGCGKGGDAFSFIEEIEGIGFREALELLAERAGVELRQMRRDPAVGGAAETPDRSREILELSTKFYEKQLWEGVGRKSALPYLRERGLTDESIRLFRLGYAPTGWRNILDFLLSRGYRTDEIERAGLIIRKSRDDDAQSAVAGRQSHYDRFRDRIMFPITDVIGRVIGYSARVAPGGDESQAKYINTPETGLYRKSRVLYGIYQAKQSMKEAGSVILVEGNMDVIAMHQSGLANTVAVSGTALTSDHLDLLGRYGKEVKLFFDMDEAGQKAAWKAALLAYEREMRVSIVALSEGKDAADAALQDPTALARAVAGSVPAAKYFLDRTLVPVDLRTPEGKRDSVDAYAPLLRSLHNPIDRAHWFSAFATAVGVEEKVLSDVVYRESGPRRTIPLQTSPERIFGKRSEMLADRIVGILAVRPDLRSAIDAYPRASAAIAAHPLDAVSRSGVGEASESASPESKRAFSKIVFEAERFIGELPETESVPEEWYLGLVLDLERELMREERSRVAAMMEEARQRGDRAEERRLAEAFKRLSSEESA